MFQIGIDVGSTYTKYCIVENGCILDLKSERSPLHQMEHFQRCVEELEDKYPGARIVSCGYGKGNVHSVKQINELTALAEGSFFATGENCLVLDIGGQDTKIIRQEGGRLMEFFLNDKCAAGSGMFLTAILERIGYGFNEIDLTKAKKPDIQLSSTCAVFAQSEIVELIANNRNETDIVEAVIWQILVKSKKIIDKIADANLLLSGGLTQIKGIKEFSSIALNRKCEITKYKGYLSAIGCALTA